MFISSNEATAAATGKFCNVPSAIIPFLSSSLIFAIFDIKFIPKKINNKFRITKIDDV